MYRAHGMLAAVFSLVGATVAFGQTEAERILDRAIQAHGGAPNLTRLVARQSKTRGQLPGEKPMSFTQEIVSQPPLQIKEITQIQTGEVTATVVTVLNGGTGRIEVNGQSQPLSETMLNELKESAYVAHLARLVVLTSKDYQLTPLGESVVMSRLTRGIRVASPGHREVSLFFDQEYGVLSKTERLVLDLRTQRMVREESLYSDWRAVDGLVTPTKVTVMRDGYKFSEVEVTEIHFLEKVSGEW